MLTLKQFIKSNLTERFRSRFDKENPGDFEVKVKGSGKAGEKEKSYTVKKANNEYHAQNIAMKKFKDEHPEHSEYSSASLSDVKKVS